MIIYNKFDFLLHFLCSNVQLEFWIRFVACWILFESHSRATRCAQCGSLRLTKSATEGCCCRGCGCGCRQHTLCWKSSHTLSRALTLLLSRSRRVRACCCCMCVGSECVRVCASMLVHLHKRFGCCVYLCCCSACVVSGCQWVDRTCSLLVPWWLTELLCACVCLCVCIELRSNAPELCIVNYHLYSLLLSLSFSFFCVCCWSHLLFVYVHMCALRISPNKSARTAFVR